MLAAHCPYSQRQPLSLIRYKRISPSRNSRARHGSISWPCPTWNASHSAPFRREPERCPRASHSRRSSYTERSPTPAHAQAVSSAETLKPLTARRWCWQPQNLLWKGALWFLIGSVFFILGSFCGLFTAVHSSRWQYRLLVLWPYAFASPMYTCGQFCFVKQAHINLQAAMSGRQEADHSKGKRLEPALLHHPLVIPGGLMTQEQRSTPPSKAFSKLTAAASQSEEGFWAVVDYLGALGVAIGTMLYNLSCATPAILDAWKMTLPFDPSTWLVLVPNVVAGLLFVLGSYASWAVCYKSWSLAAGNPRTTAFWALVSYMMGSFGFFAGCLMMTRPILGSLSSILVSEWFGLLFGYALGSCCFFLGSYIMILDAKAN